MLLLMLLMLLMLMLLLKLICDPSCQQDTVLDESLNASVRVVDGRGGELHLLFAVVVATDGYRRRFSRWDKMQRQQRARGTGI